MNKHYLFIGIVFGIVVLLVQFIIIGYENSNRSEDLWNLQKEIAYTNEEISRLTFEAKWWDTPATRVYLKKLNTDEKLPWEKVIILVPELISGEYSVNQSINQAQEEAKTEQALSIPEKWNALLRWKKLR